DGFAVLILRREQVIKQEPVPVLVVLIVLAEFLVCRSDVTAAVVDQITCEQNQISILGGVVHGGERVVPVVELYGLLGDLQNLRRLALEISCIHVVANVDVRIGDVADRQRGLQIPPHEQRMQHLGGLLSALELVVRVVQTPVFEPVSSQK